MASTGAAIVVFCTTPEQAADFEDLGVEYVVDANEPARELAAAVRAAYRTTRRPHDSLTGGRGLTPSWRRPLARCRACSWPAPLAASPDAPRAAPPRGPFPSPAFVEVAKRARRRQRAHGLIAERRPPQHQIVEMLDGFMLDDVLSTGRLRVEIAHRPLVAE